MGGACGMHDKEEKKNACTVLVGKLEVMRPLGMKAWRDAKIILKVILDRIGGWDFCGSVFMPVAVLSEDGNELSGSLKFRGFLDFLRNYDAFKDYALRIGTTVVLGWPFNAKCNQHGRRVVS